MRFDWLQWVTSLLLHSVTATVFVMIIVSWRGMTMSRPFDIIEGVLFCVITLILWVMFSAHNTNPALLNIIVSGPFYGTRMMDILVTPSRKLTPPWNQIWNTPSLNSPVTCGILFFLRRFIILIRTGKDEFGWFSKTFFTFFSGLKCPWNTLHCYHSYCCQS